MSSTEVACTDKSINMPIAWTFFYYFLLNNVNCDLKKLLPVKMSFIMSGTKFIRAGVFLCQLFFFSQYCLLRIEGQTSVRMRNPNNVENFVLMGGKKIQTIKKTKLMPEYLHGNVKPYLRRFEEIT